MNRQLSCLTLLVFFASTLACAGGAPPGGAEEAFEWVGTFTTVGMQMAPGDPGARSTFDGRCSVPSDWVIRFEAAVESPTHGPLTGEVEHCSRIVTWRTVEGSPVPDSASFGDGRFSMTAPDGATLTGTYGEGVGATNPDGSVWYRDVVVITGGTGRFEGVQGELDEEGAWYGPDLPGETRARGVLRFPG
jgi:hypothetical protein